MAESKLPDDRMIVHIEDEQLRRDITAHPVVQEANKDSADAPTPLKLNLEPGKAPAGEKMALNADGSLTVYDETLAKQLDAAMTVGPVGIEATDPDGDPTAAGGGTGQGNNNMCPCQPHTGP